MLSPKPIRVLVADSHEMSRIGLRIMLEIFDDFELVGEAEDGTQVLNMCAQLQPDVTLVSMSFNPGDGIDTIRMLREHNPQVNIVVLSSLYQPQDLEHALEAGANTVLIKGVPLDEIANAIRETGN